MKNMKTQSTFQHIALMGRAGKDTADTLEAVKNFLLKKKLSVSIEEKTAGLMKKNPLPTFSENAIPKQIDLMIVVGGDGSLLNAAHCALPNNLPVLGINRGHLGFLTDISPDELDKISPVLAGKYRLEKRFLLTASKNKKQLGIALNDVVLLPGEAQLIKFDIYVNGQFVSSQRADGLIVSTPTGSTAYALSAGGPILYPQLNAIVLVPMFPHRLSNRPIVVEGDADIELRIHSDCTTSPQLSCDGQHRIHLSAGDRISIKKHKKSLRLIHPMDYDYFATLREKLGWQK